MTPAFYQLSNSILFLATILDVASHLPELTFESFLQLSIFLHHQWMDITFLCCCMTFPKEIISSPKCLRWTDLITSFSPIFFVSKSSGILQYCLVWSNSLEDLFPLLLSNSFLLTHNTRSMILFNLGLMKILCSEPSVISHLRMQQKIWLLLSIQSLL